MAAFPLALLYLILVAVFTHARYRERRGAVWVLKPLCALGFLGIGVGFGLGGPDPHYVRAMGVGLLASVVGDVVLLAHGRRALGGGIVAFAVAHAAYAVAFWPRAALHPGLVVVAVPLAVVLALTVRAAWPKLGRLKVPGTLYGGVLGGMALLAWAAFLAPDAPSGDKGTGRALAAVGATLFFVSDVAVTRERVLKSETPDCLWGVPSYFVGQLLLAASLGWG